MAPFYLDEDSAFHHEKGTLQGNPTNAKEFGYAFAAESNAGRASDKRRLEEGFIPGLCAASRLREARVREERVWQLHAILWQLHATLTLIMQRAEELGTYATAAETRKQIDTATSSELKQLLIFLVAQAPKNL
jgi:hypothetical protein